MTSYVVTCQTPGSYDDPIAGLGGVDWWMPTAEIARMIGTEQHYFWIPLQGEEVHVVVKELGMGRSTLTTRADFGSSRPYTLLDLPECQRTEF
jgi:hypothetical protein